MSRSYKLKTFLRHLDRNLFDEWLHLNVGISEALPRPAEGEDEAEVWERFINSLPSEKISEIETAFRDVNDLADENGVMALLDRATQMGVTPQAEIERINGAQNQAFYFLMTHPRVFRTALVMREITDLKAKATRLNLKRLPADVVAGKRERLAEAIRSFLLAQDGRGRHCQVDIYTDNRICFIAHPEDFAKTATFYKGGLLQRDARRHSFEIVFIYHPDTGKLELNTKGGKKRELALFNIFNNVVLEDDSPVLEHQRVYNLNRFLERDFTMPTDIEDQVEYVRLQSLRIENKYVNYRLTLEVPNGAGVFTMSETLDRLNIARDAVNVMKATIQMKFPGHGRRGGVRIELSHPDKCNLNDSPLHLKAKKYLAQWGIEDQQPAPPTTNGHRHDPALAPA